MSLPKPVIVAVLLLVVAGCASVAASACTLGSGYPEKDLAAAFKDSDEVFTARLESFRKIMPPAGEQTMFIQSDYTLLEVFKGHPKQQGVLTERDPYSPLPGNPPGPACGPWLIHADSPGTLALVFVRHEKEGWVDYLWAHPYSRRLDPQWKSTEETLDLIRSLKLENEKQ